MDAAAVGVLGALLSYVNNGEAAAEGWVVGAVFGIFYLLLLQQDVSVITMEVNPFNLTNPWRVLRFLLPFTLVAGLGLQHATEIGLEEWWQNVSLMHFVEHRVGGCAKAYAEPEVPSCFIIFSISLATSFQGCFCNFSY